MCIAAASVQLAHPPAGGAGRATCARSQGTRPPPARTATPGRRAAIPQLPAAACWRACAAGRWAAGAHRRHRAHARAGCLHAVGGCWRRPGQPHLAGRQAWDCPGRGQLASLPKRSLLSDTYVTCLLRPGCEALPCFTTHWCMCMHTGRTGRGSSWHRNMQGLSAPSCQDRLVRVRAGRRSTRTTSCGGTWTPQCSSCTPADAPAWSSTRTRTTWSCPGTRRARHACAAHTPHCMAALSWQPLQLACPGA